MPSFADSFWSLDYSGGIDALLSKLYQGCVENDEFIGLFTSKMEHELQYGKKMIATASQCCSSPLGFSMDEGASLKASFKGIAEELGKEGEARCQMGDKIKTLILEPFGTWSRDHRQRLQYSDKIMLAKLKEYNQLKAKNEKSKKKYFNKCRVLEEVRANFESEKLLINFINAQPTKAPTRYFLGDFEYDNDHMKEILKRMLLEIPKKAHKVTLLGTYQNCSSGAEIAHWLKTNLGQSKIEQLEKMGQDLLENGFLRLVGSMGNNFMNSTQMYYQWRPYSFKYAGVTNSASEKSMANFTDYFDDIMSTVTKFDVTDRAAVKKLYDEVTELDRLYFEETVELDAFRCELEETIIDHYSFLEKCELDRLKALKRITSDFNGIISTFQDSLKKTVDNLMLYEESIQPLKDLNFLLENFRTGYYQPKVELYDNFYQSSLKQIFGVDIGTRCRFDKKPVPIIVSSILVYMDSVYPVLEDDAVRLNCWISPVRLQLTHSIRAKLNELASDDQKIYSIKSMHEVFKQYESPAVVSSALKLYLLELPDSLIPSEYFDSIKALYQQYVGVDDQLKRIKGLTSFLSNLPTANVATLDSILTHFTRMIATVGSDEKDDKKAMIDQFVHNLSNEFSTIVLRSNNGYPTTNLFATKLFTDLLQNRSSIFDELKAHQRSATRHKKSLPKIPLSSSPSSSSPTSSTKSSNIQTRLQDAVRNGKRNVSNPDDSSSLKSVSRGLSSIDVNSENVDASTDDTKSPAITTSTTLESPTLEEK